MKTIPLPAGTEYVQFDELAHKIAIALYPSDDSATEGESFAYFGARDDLEAQLLQAAKSGALPAKDPLTFGPHSFPFRRALKKSLVSVSDLRVFLAGRPIAIESGPAQTAETPAPVVAVGASGGVKPDKAGPVWSLKASIQRAPGYRWPLYQVLKAAFIAGQPCPKARDVLNIWRLNPPPDVQAMPDGVKYDNGLGKPKEADLKAIGQAIKNLMK